MSRFCLKPIRLPLTIHNHCLLAGRRLLADPRNPLTRLTLVGDNEAVQTAERDGRMKPVARFAQTRTLFALAVDSACQNQHDGAPQGNAPSIRKAPKATGRLAVGDLLRRASLIRPRRVSRSP
jgi:hypothetical protein